MVEDLLGVTILSKASPEQTASLHPQRQRGRGKAMASGAPEVEVVED